MISVTVNTSMSEQQVCTHLNGRNYITFDGRWVVFQLHGFMQYDCKWSTRLPGSLCVCTFMCIVSWIILPSQTIRVSWKRDVLHAAKGRWVWLLDYDVCTAGQPQLPLCRQRRLSRVHQGGLTYRRVSHLLKYSFNEVVSVMSLSHF